MQIHIFRSGDKWTALGASVTCKPRRVEGLAALKKRRQTYAKLAFFTVTSSPLPLPLALCDLGFIYRRAGHILASAFPLITSSTSTMAGGSKLRSKIAKARPRSRNQLLHALCQQT